MMKYTEFVDMATKALNSKTLYVMGCFGVPMTDANKRRYCNNHDFNKKADRTTKIQSATNDTFGFDCVNLIKGILWGWNADTSKAYGGAVYKSNGVPDVNANTFFSQCTAKSKDFSNVPIGAILHIDGHVGIYIGAGYAIESTYRNTDGVQRTIVKNIKDATVSGVITRKWDEWGLTPYVDYDIKTTPSEVLNQIYNILLDAKNKGVF